MQEHYELWAKSGMNPNLESRIVQNILKILIGFQDGLMNIF